MGALSCAEGFSCAMASEMFQICRSLKIGEIAAMEGAMMRMKMMSLAPARQRSASKRRCLGKPLARSRGYPKEWVTAYLTCLVHCASWVKEGCSAGELLCYSNDRGMHGSGNPDVYLLQHQCPGKPGITPAIPERPSHACMPLMR